MCARLMRQVLNLVVAEVAAGLLALPWEIDTAGDVEREPSILDGSVDDPGEDAESADDDRRALAGRKPTHPVLHLAVLDLADSAGAPDRLDVDAPCGVEHVEGGWFEMRLGPEPGVAEFVD